MTTASEAFRPIAAAAAPGGGPVSLLKRPGVRERASARVASLLRVTPWLKVMWADVRSAWWAPASLPTVARVWAVRMPDRSLVPGDSAVLYRGWLVYNHVVAVPAAAAVVAVVTALSVGAWLLTHPARLLLAAVVAAPFAATAVAFVR